MKIRTNKLPGKFHEVAAPAGVTWQTLRFLSFLNLRATRSAWAVAFPEDDQVDEYRGYTFVNAAAVYGQPDHPVRLMAIAQRRWINQITETLLGQIGHPEPLAATRALLALRTGYVFSTGLEEDEGWAEQFLAAHDRIVSPS